jgi:hypothetical protein
MELLVGTDIVTASTGSPVTLAMGGDPIGIKNGDSIDQLNRLSGCNTINSNWRTNLQYVNLSCFTPPAAQASMAAQCATNSFLGAATTPGGQIYCANLFGNAGRNTLVGPGLVNFDFSVFKNNKISRFSESFNVQFCAEMFNGFNHANFQAPIDNSTLFNSDGSVAGGAGTLGKTTTDSREIQLSLKVIW